MVGMFGQKVPQSQANGPDVELHVYGTEFYARYETPGGYSAIYDEALGLYCYAALEGGAFVSTGVPVTGQPPANAVLHGQEDDSVRAEKIRRQEKDMGGR